MSLVDKYPHPGPAPEKPDPNIPYGHTENEKKRWAYNDWVRATRRHEVARSVDQLEALPRTGTRLTPEQAIAIHLGRAFLEDTLSSHTPFGGMF